MDRKVTKKRMPSFADFCFRESGADVKGRGRPAEPFSHLLYNEEYLIRDRAFQRFCDAHHLKVPDALVPAPVPRGYRTTSKRKVVISGRDIRLLADMEDLSGVSLLEPEAHQQIFTEIETYLQGLHGKLRSAFNYCIIRGTDNCALIFNVNFTGGALIKILDKIAHEIAAKIPALTSSFVFNDPSRSKYYLESSVQADFNSFKRLFGPRMLSAKAGGILFHYHPLSFSQVNIPVAEKIGTHLSEYFGKGKGLLADLYCGYGFFSCIVGRNFSEVIGIDSAQDSVLSAVDNAKHVSGFPKNSFYVKRIDVKAIQTLLPDKKGYECMILDPPRKGCVPGVIAACADRRPEKVAHIFCGPDEIPGELEQWKSCGYKVVRIIPFDMFPGTASIETVVFLEPEKISDPRRKR
jgi:tRNA/tmRNA/rRNA uracil-C5-methylase (TrmA/RlmC/RlmD family)